MCTSTLRQFFPHWHHQREWSCIVCRRHRWCGHSCESIYALLSILITSDRKENRVQQKALSKFNLFSIFSFTFFHLGFLTASCPWFRGGSATPKILSQCFFLLKLYFETFWEFSFTFLFPPLSSRAHARTGGGTARCFWGGNPFAVSFSEWQIQRNIRRDILKSIVQKEKTQQNCPSALRESGDR